MGVLRDHMIRELQLRRFAPATQRAYLEAVVGLTKHFGVAPDQLSARQVQDYLLYLMLERHLQWNTVNTIASGLTFFYTQTLRRPDIALAMPIRRTPRRLPEILSAAELEALFAAAANQQHRARVRSLWCARFYGFSSGTGTANPLIPHLSFVESFQEALVGPLPHVA